MNLKIFAVALAASIMAIAGAASAKTVTFLDYSCADGCNIIDPVSSSNRYDLATQDLAITLKMVTAGADGLVDGRLQVRTYNSKAPGSGIGSATFLFRNDQNETLVVDRAEWGRDPGTVISFGDCTSGLCASFTNFFSDPADGDGFILEWRNAEVGTLITANLAAVPVPAAGFLLMGALAGFGALRRRKKA